MNTRPSKRFHEAEPVRIITSQLSMVIDNRIDSPDHPRRRRQFIEIFQHSRLVRHRQVEPKAVQIPECPDRFPKLLRQDTETELDRIDSESAKTVIVHLRRNAVRYRVPEQPSESCVASNLIFHRQSGSLHRIYLKKASGFMPEAFCVVLFGSSASS